MKSSLFFLAQLLVMMVLSAGIASSQVYELIDLGMTNATGLNDSGVVIGYEWFGGEIYYAYTWTNGVKNGLGSLVPGGSSVAYGINNASQIVGYSWRPGVYDSNHAFLWDNSIMTDLGTLGGSSSQARAINDSAEIVGWSISDSTLNGHAFLWKDGTMIDLGTLGGEGSSAADINNLGQVVGHSRIADSVNIHAFLWQGSGLEDLGTLGGDGSRASAINNLGHVVGNSDVESNRSAGFIMRGGAMAELGAIAPRPGYAFGWSTPYDINDLDEAVGSSSWDNPPGTDPVHAFIWSGGLMTDLNGVTDTSGGWKLLRAVGINNRGEIIALANRHGTQQSCLLKRTSIILTSPGGGERWISGDKDTIRWISGLAPGEQIGLQYSLDDGQTWLTFSVGYPADSEKYAWTVPDTFSTKARIRIASLLDTSKNDISKAFTFKGYLLTKLSPTGAYIGYDIATDRWGFDNSPEGVWPPSWYGRFDYGGIDPMTGKNYQSAGPSTNHLFNNTRSSDHPDWPAFVSTFGVAWCYRNTTDPVYSPTAVAKWASVRGEWGGSCFGIAVSNALAFRLKSNFSLHYFNYPEFVLPILVSSDTNTIPVINELFTHQFGKPHTTYRNDIAVMKTPNQTLADVKALLISDDDSPRTLGILNNGEGGGGHAILPYKLKQDPDHPELYYLYVYDNSNPNVTDAHIVIDTSQNGGDGSWSFSLWDGWGGPRWIYLRDPSFSYLSQPVLPAADPEFPQSPFILAANELRIHLTGEAEVKIEDGNGNVSGYVDSLMRADIPGSAPLVLENGSMTPPYGYSLPLNPYSVRLSEFAAPDPRVYFFTGNKTFTVERVDATNAQTDHMFFDGGLAVANPDTGTKTIDITSILNDAPREKVFSAQGLTLSQFDSLKLAYSGPDGLRLSWFGATSGTYRLELELDSDTGVGLFAHDGVQIAANTAQIIHPVWTTLAVDYFNILIDMGNDGTIDDTLELSNDVTEVGDRGPRLIPTQYNLAQNYPNPFNPTTTIRYELPQASHITLKIHNVLGETVATLVDGFEQAGYKSVGWNAHAIPSGVYFYTLQAGSFIEMKKMIVIK